MYRREKGLAGSAHRHSSCALPYLAEKIKLTKIKMLVFETKPTAFILPTNNHNMKL